MKCMNSIAKGKDCFKIWDREIELNHISWTLGSASSLKIMCIKDITRKENTGVGFFSSSNTTEGYSEVSDEYQRKISYRM